MQLLKRIGVCLQDAYFNTFILIIVFYLNILVQEFKKTQPHRIRAT